MTNSRRYMFLYLPVYWEGPWRTVGTLRLRNLEIDRIEAVYDLILSTRLDYVQSCPLRAPSYSENGSESN